MFSFKCNYSQGFLQCLLCRFRQFYLFFPLAKVSTKFSTLGQPHIKGVDDLPSTFQLHTVYRVFVWEWVYAGVPVCVSRWKKRNKIENGFVYCQRLFLLAHHFYRAKITIHGLSKWLSFTFGIVFSLRFGDRFCVD